MLKKNTTENYLIKMNNNSKFFKSVIGYLGFKIILYLFNTTLMLFLLNCDLLRWHLSCRKIGYDCLLFVGNDVDGAVNSLSKFLLGDYFWSEIGAKTLTVNL